MTKTKVSNKNKRDNKNKNFVRVQNSSKGGIDVVREDLDEYFNEGE
jgi:hypothetical protein